MIGAIFVVAAVSVARISPLSARTTRGDEAAERRSTYGARQRQARSGDQPVSHRLS